MNINLSETELIFLYGRLKNELTIIKSSKQVHTSKSEMKFYENLISKMEEAYPPLVNLPI